MRGDSNPADCYSWSPTLPQNARKDGAPRCVRLFGHYSFERFAGGDDGGGYFLFAVGCAEERGLKLRGRQPDAPIEHGAVEAAKGGSVGPGGLVVVCNWSSREKPGTHGADAVEGQRDAGVGGFGGYSLEDGFGSGFKLGINLGGVVL